MSSPLLVSFIWFCTSSRSFSSAFFLSLAFFNRFWTSVSSPSAPVTGKTRIRDGTLQPYNQELELRAGYPEGLSLLAVRPAEGRLQSVSGPSLVLRGSASLRSTGGTNIMDHTYSIASSSSSIVPFVNDLTSKALSAASLASAAAAWAALMASVMFL